MKWQFEFPDLPKNPLFPITGYQEMDNGVKRGPFYIKMEDFLEAMTTTPDGEHDADALRKEEVIVTPPLPFGTIRYSANESQTRERLSLEIQKKQWDILYANDTIPIYIGFPRMVVQYLVETSKNTRKVVETRLYAVLDDNKAITDETSLYQFPFTNVGKSNGIVCWGQNARFELEDLTELHRLFHSFISAPFNEDHGVSTTLGIPNFRKLIDQIQEQVFDDEWLVPHRQTFGSLFE